MYQRGTKMKNEQRKNNKEKVAFICFLIASMGYYISAVIGIFSKDGSNWVVNMCLGSAFLCLSTTHLNKDEDKNDKDK